MSRDSVTELGEESAAVVTIQVRIERDVSVLDVEGRLTGGSETKNIQRLVKDLLKEGRSKILLNLTKVPWGNALAVSVLIASYVSAKREGARLEICGLSNRLELIMRTMVLIPDLFAGFRTEEEALESLGDPPGPGQRP